jgi:hypothetical protein
MIVNAYAVVDAFLSLCRLGLGLGVLSLGLVAGWSWCCCAPAPESRQAVEDRCYLLFLLAHLLLGLNVLSWPILYLLLQSYVPEWPGVMCIYGVTQIGAGSLGPSRWLPLLLVLLQALKPALVFVSGAWFVLYLLGRSTRTAPLTGRVLLVLMAVGVLAIGDAAVELTYLVIPKKEEFLSTGCCAVAFDEQPRALAWLPGGPEEQANDSGWFAVYYGVNLVLILVLASCGWLIQPRSRRLWLLPLMLGAILSLMVNAAFLVEEAAPRLLHLPYHHCPYDLIPQVPESLVAVALFVGGSFCVGWAGVVGWLGNTRESRAQVPVLLGRLLRLGCYAYLGSVLLMSLELVLA